MTSGILDRARVVSNILLLVLLAGNIFLSIQYIYNIGHSQSAQTVLQTQEQATVATQFLKLFVNKVLSTNGTISYTDRVDLEADVRSIGDADILKSWDTFVSATSSASAQTQAVNLMAEVINKIQLSQNSAMVAAVNQ